MLTVFHKKAYTTENALEEFDQMPNLTEEIEKTRIALELAYAGFNYAVDDDIIDAYIYEINSLLKRYGHLDSLKKSRKT